MRKRINHYMNILNDRANIIYGFYYISIILTVILGIYIAIYCNKNSPSKSKINSNNLIDFNNGWYDKKNNPIDISCFKRNEGVIANKEYTFYHKTDSSIKEGDTLCFRALSTDVTMYIGNNIVLETNYKKNILSCKSPGSVWYFYKIKKSDLNQNFKLNIKTCYNDNACYIDTMYIGDKSTFLLLYLKQNILSILLSILIMFTGVIFVLIDIYINFIQKINRHTLFNIGIFSILIATWSMLSTHLQDFIPNASQAAQLLSCSLLYLIPTSAALFLSDYFKNIKTKLVTINCIFNSVFYILAWILHLTRYKDFHETLILSHIVIIFTIILTIIQFILYRKNSKSKFINIDNSKPRYLSISNIIFSLIMLCFMGDIFIFYSKANSNTGIFTQFASLLIIMYLGVLSFKNIYDLDKQITHNKFVRELAYTDGLTGLSNRTAFMEKIEQLENTKTNFNSIGIVTFDVNNLKITNDTFGHSVGDDLIISAANLIKSTFDDNCKSYRIGGDEFIVIIEADNAETLYKVNSIQLNVNIQNFNNFFNKQYKLSIAYGCAFYKPNQNITLHDVLNKSDKEMYTNKINQKKQDKSS